MIEQQASSELLLRLTRPPDLLAHDLLGALPQGITTKIGSLSRSARLPKSDIAAPGIGQNGPRQASASTSQAADLWVCVELRGFEPLTPSMRTEHSGQQGRCL
jgi:hypothetical protein